MGIQLFFLVLRARYKIVLAIFLIAMLGAVAAIIFMPNKYTATASVLLDTKSPDPLLGTLTTPLNYMATQSDIINSDRVARKVVKLLRLDESPQVRLQWQNESKGKEPLVEWLGKLMGKGLTVRPSQESNVISITYTATEPGFAAATANAFAQAYIDTNIELKVEPARQYAAWFQDRAKELRADLEKAQSKLAEYQRVNEIVATNDHQPTDEHSKIYELSKQLTEAEVEAADTRSRRKSLGDSDTMPDVMKNTVIQNIKEKIITQEAKLQELRSTLGSNHPQYLVTEEQIAELKRTLSQESRHILNSVNTANSVNKQRAAELKAAIETHKKLAVEDRQKLDQMAVLQREVSSAQKAYDAVVQHFTDSSLLGQANQTNISVLNPATTPIERSTPQVFKTFVKAAIAGLLVGFGWIIGLELISPRVRSSTSLGVATGMPMLIEFTRDAGLPSKQDRIMGFVKSVMEKLTLKKSIHYTTRQSNIRMRIK